MEFPVPEASPTFQRSIAERDRNIVLGTSIGALVPIGIVVSLLVEPMLSRLVITFLLAMLVAVTLAFFLRSRFIASFTTADLRIQPSGRSLSARAQRHADELVASGFALTNIVVLSDNADRVLTRPFALFRRVVDDQAAICGELGVSLVSRFDDHALVVTASHEVVKHPSILLQHEPDANVAEVSATHTAALSEIRSTFHVEPQIIDPISAFIEVERREQETLGSAKGMDTLHRSLVANSDPLQAESVRTWLREYSTLDV